MSLKSTKYDVTFETKVYENDWKYILKGNYLKKMIDNCNYQFCDKILMINNVRNIKEVCKHADLKVEEGVIDKYFIVEEFAIQALKHFNLEIDSFKGGYYYSISELVSIYLCHSDYLLHFSSDSFIENKDVNWINKAIQIFKERNDIIVANPTWNFAFFEAEKESISEIDDFYLGYGFSDQCYLIKTNFFKKNIYNELNSYSNRYPKYGGELFEKRIDSYMRNHNFYRITSKEISYTHRNFPKNKYLLFNNIINKFIINKRMSDT